MPTLEQVKSFWEAHPVGGAFRAEGDTAYDYLRRFDARRETLEPPSFGDLIHGYSRAPGLNVLDYGCGNGYVLAQYAKNGARVWGIDIAQAAIDWCNIRFHLMGLEGTFIRGEGQTIPLESGFFDIACSMGVLHHFDNPEAVVREMYRCLKPGGTIIIMLYHRNSYHYNVTARYWKYFGPATYRGKEIADIIDMTDGASCPKAVAYTREEAVELLGDFVDHRFFVDNLQWRELALYNPLARRLASRILPESLLRILAARIGWNLYCVAKRP